MTGLEKLRAICGLYCLMGGGVQPVAIDKLQEIADQIERETLPRPLFEDGTPVQFGDAVCCDDGYTFTVDAIEVMRDGWFSLSQFSCSVSIAIQPGARVKRPEPPDTWERIEDDALKSACEYYGHGKQPCKTCPANKLGLTCSQHKTQDLVRRCKALAGVE